MIMTSNRGFAEWAEIFGDAVVATALLDRLLHHAVVVPIQGNSYPSVVMWVRRWREQRANAPPRAAFVPMRFQLGDTFQFDWSRAAPAPGGSYEAGQLAHNFRVVRQEGPGHLPPTNQSGDTKLDPEFPRSSIAQKVSASWSQIPGAKLGL